MKEQNANKLNNSRFRVCNKCKSEIGRDILESQYYTCPTCGNLLRIHAKKRIAMLSDSGSFKEWDKELSYKNSLGDKEYQQKLNKAVMKHNMDEAVMIGRITLDGQPAAIGVMDTRFMMATMGYVVGEKITRLFERALKLKLPVILFCCSGGARIQEGITSLMQMEKTAMAIKKFQEAGLLYISLLTHPTMGGVTASFAMLGDIILAESNAMIGFAGPRVIEQTTGKTLPSGFQRAEFQLEHGFVDDIVTRSAMREYLSGILMMHQRGKKRKLSEKMKNKYNIINANNFANQDAKKDQPKPWERVKIARMNERPTSLHFINKLFDGFTEFHGDRYFGDDRAIVGGIAMFHGLAVTVISQQKGKTSLEEAMYRNYGMPSPEGYRKSLRLMKQAEKHQRPIICLIDTVGAYCGDDAEKRGQGEAIAQMLLEMSTIKVPILSIIISEGGSGGALALGVGNEVWMLENSIYSVISPEGYASILWGTNEKAPEAAASMKLTSKDLLESNIIERVIPEPVPVTVKNMKDMCSILEYNILNFLNKYQSKTSSYIIKERYMRFRKF